MRNYCPHRCLSLLSVEFLFVFLVFEFLFIFFFMIFCKRLARLWIAIHLLPSPPPSRSAGQGIGQSFELFLSVVTRSLAQKKKNKVDWVGRGGGGGIKNVMRLRPCSLAGTETVSLLNFEIVCQLLSGNYIMSIPSIA